LLRRARADVRPAPRRHRAGRHGRDRDGRLARGVQAPVRRGENASERSVAGYALPARSWNDRKGPCMATLAYSHEEIAPRELKPTLFELDGISRATVEAHYKLYQGY